MARLFIFLLSFIAFQSLAQDVMIQSWYWDYPKTANGANWTDTLINKATDFGEAGITHVWLPPFSRASFGSGSNGYDPQDLYDLGEYGLGATGFGTRTQVDAVISAMNTAGIEAVADVIYNHRDGGKAEINTAVEGWIENYDCTKVIAGDQPFPSDRVRYLLPIGGATGNGAGTYYFKIRSASKHPNFYGSGYTFYAETNTVGFQNAAPLTENEGDNGGGDCGQNFDAVPLGVDMQATVDNVGGCGGFCGLDEFGITLTASDFNPAGDTIFIYMTNTGAYSDHYVSFIWNGSTNVQPQLIYETYTDFTSMPSGQGQMNYTNFKPNGNPTQLNGDFDFPYFFYDYDQDVSSTRDVLTDWTQWLWNDVNIRGLRMDAVKHFKPDFVGNLMDSLHQVNMHPSMVVGEFFDFNPFVLNNWVNDVKTNMDAATNANIEVKVFDFSLREALKNACDLFGYDARDLYNSGIVGGAGGPANQAVTFVNNHDFRDGDQPVQNDPLLAYAYILLNRTVGTPNIFYPDYTGTTIPHAPTWNMGSDIKKMISAFNNFMDGGSMDYLNRFGTPYTINFFDGVDNASIIFSTANGGLSNNDDAIVLINFAGDTLDVEVPLSTATNQLPGTVFTELSGKGLIPFNATDANNKIRVAVPPRSYGVWVSESIHNNCPNDTIIYVDENAVGINSGSDWENAYTSLAAAINQVNICANINEIWIKEGTYLSSYLNDRKEGFKINSSVKIRGGFPSAGSPTIVDYDPLNNPTILSGDIGMSAVTSDNVYHVVEITGGSPVELIGLKIENGNADGTDSIDKSGAGVLNNSNLKMVDCTISNCSANTSGVAIYSGAGSMTMLENCLLESNSGGDSDVLIAGSGAIEVIGNNEVKN